MRNGIRTWLAGATCAAVMLTGCSKVETCNVSPIEIEELREDISVIDKDLAVVHDRARQLSEELATKQAELDSKKDKPDELRRRLELLKRGSGRIEKKAEAKKASEKKGAKDSKESS